VRPEPSRRKEVQLGHLAIFVAQESRKFRQGWKCACCKRLPQRHHRSTGRHSQVKLSQEGTFVSSGDGVEERERVDPLLLESQYKLKETAKAPVVDDRISKKRFSCITF